MLKTFDIPIHIIGGGLAGCEASWQIAQSGISVVLHEMRPEKKSDAHKTDKLAELVCSNSFRCDDSLTNAVGLLHAEMRLAKSLIMKAADANKVPAGSALAVDRDGFSKTVTTALENHPLITIKREEVQEIPKAWKHVVIATGPLTSPALAQKLQAITGIKALSFFDAIAPIIHTDSID
ncbi:methylenetetrahydrofolate--tRNA-(uracil(54)-C(5))-methyltransferase (FADH(2)-oxidizing) TrmFO, partial [Bartonella sp. AP57NXGY]